MMEPSDIILGDKSRYRRTFGKHGRRVVTGIALVFAVSYVFWASSTVNERTRIRQALVDISRIEHAARLFRADFGRCPDSLDELALPNGDRRYLSLKKDPWGKPYQLRCPAMLDPGGVYVVSGGPDGSLRGEDNISSL